MNYLYNKSRLTVLYFFCILAVSLNAQPNIDIADVTPPSAEAASLGKFIEMPPASHTGVISVPINLYTVQSNKLSLPITLSYHSGGIKVNELSTWVGTGWNLTPGGMINRSINGLPDDQTYGFPQVVNEIDINDFGFYINAIQGIKDTEPDMYSLSMPGQSFKFTLNESGEFVTFPDNGVRIEAEYSGYTVSTFTAITPDGTRYIFAPSGHSYISEGSPQINKTEWHLERIETNDLKGYIDFEYETVNYQTKISPHRYLLYTTEGNSQSLANHSTQVVSTQRLSKIITPLQTIEFIANTQREDLVSDPIVNTAKSLDEIKITNGTKSFSWHFTYDYFTSSQSNALEIEDKRLRLVSLQKISNSDTSQEPPYIFDYYKKNNEYFLPNRLTKALDFWNYYNEKSSNNSNLLNIPTITSGYGYECNAGLCGSDRFPDSTAMLYGALKEVKTPLGGTINYSYAANRFEYDQINGSIPPTVNTTNENLGFSIQSCTNIDGGGDCCGLASDEGQYTFINQANQIYGFFKIQILKNLNLAGGTCNMPAWAEAIFSVKDANQTIVYTQTININQLLADAQLDPNYPDVFIDHIVNIDISEMGLNLNEEYTFDIASENVFAKASLFKLSARPDVDGSFLTGGLRIKEVVIENPIDPSNSMSYNYTYGPGTLNELYPRFIADFSRIFYYISGIAILETQINGSYIFESPRRPLSNINGQHITYATVHREISNFQGGKETFTYFQEPTLLADESSGIFPSSLPQFPILDDGLLLNKKTYLGNTNNITSEENYNYNTSDYSSFNTHIWKNLSLTISGEQEYFSGFPALYWHRTKAQKLLSSTSTIDGVTTGTSYIYGTENIFPISVKTTNSDGIETETKNYYAHDYDLNNSVKDALIDKNMILPPYKTEIYKDGLLVDGTEKKFEFFNSFGIKTNSPSDRIYPYEVKRFEPVWDLNGITSGGIWDLQYSHQKYSINTGQVEILLVNNWSDPVLLSYNAIGQQESKTYKDHFTDYVYFPNSTLLNGVINIDHSRTTYDYDGLFRLNNIATKAGDNTIKSSTTLDYIIPGTGANQLIQSTDYQGTAPTKTIYKNFDGLGRPTSVVNQDFVQANNVVTQAWEYDNVGRVSKQLLLPNGSMKELVYEESPLNRIEEEIFPDGNRKSYDYRSNNISIATANANYPSGSLNVIELTDEKLQKSTSYIDKIGRSIASKDALGNLTTYAFYKNDNIKEIRSPENSAYKYFFEKNDLLVGKSIPGQTGLHTYTYNPRDLVEVYTDPNLDATTTLYDLYGRPIETLLNGVVIGETFYDNYYNVGYMPGTNEPLLYGKVTGSYTKTLDANPVTIWSSIHYDKFGRVEKENSQSHIANKENQVIYTYNLADQLLNSTKTFDGLHLSENFTYDTWDRMVSHDIAVQGAGPSIFQDISYQEYNLQGLLATKQLGGQNALQELDYTYNKRGWLRAINQNLDPFNATSLLPSCDPISSVPDNNIADPIDGTSMSLLQFLENRFENELLIEGYEQCETVVCPEFNCDPSQQLIEISDLLRQFEIDISDSDEIICADGSTITQLEINFNLIGFPFEIHRVRICDNSEFFIPANYITSLSLDYAILQTIEVTHPSQMFALEQNNQIVEIDLATLLSLIIDGTANPPGIDNYVDCGSLSCETVFPDCTAQELLDQQNGINAIMNASINFDYNSLSTPITLYLVSFCEGSVYYVTSDEYDNWLDGTGVIILDTLVFNNLDEEVITDEYLNENDQNDLFYLQLDYEANGNIKDQYLQIAGRNVFKHHYQYDPLNRLTSANFAELFKENGQNMMTNENRFGVSNLTYDFDGNINSLSRNGITGYCSSGIPEYGTIDQMVYTQGAVPNQISSINDATNDPRGFPGNSGASYEYDSNGNLTKDPYKGITDIDYNYLNLPDKLANSKFYVVENLYDGIGSKRQSKYTAHGVLQKTNDYFGNIEYVDGNLKSIYFPDVRLDVKADGNIGREFTIADHLGNTRLSISDVNGDGKISTLMSDGEILQENHFYAFGMSWDASEMSPWFKPSAINDVNLYQYNGKELQNETMRMVDDYEVGLGLYDYGARFYDSSNGRWTSIDPKAHWYYSHSPYNYVLNNPISNIDPNGEFVGTLIGGAIGAGIAAWRGESIKKGFISGAVAGAVFDITIATAGTGTVALIGAGVLSGLSGNLVDQGYDINNGEQETLNGKELIASGVIGGVLGPIAGKIGNALGGVINRLGKAVGSLRKTNINASGHSEEIIVDSADKISRDLLDPPKTSGNAPTFKKDGTSVELHHVGQNPKGPFKEMHWKDHRGKGVDKINHPNKGKPSKIDRKEFRKKAREYWKKEYRKT